tara:strand:- start:788 stop:1042 length:255 start_codon:yes stop_codon:yes gene_type:complete
MFSEETVLEIREEAQAIYDRVVEIKAIPGPRDNVCGLRDDANMKLYEEWALLEIKLIHLAMQCNQMNFDDFRAYLEMERGRRAA